MSADTRDAAIRRCDLLVALLVTPLAAPAMAAAATAVLVCLGRPVFHASRRVGRHGEEYLHYKLRTMVPGPEVGRIFFEQQRVGRCGRLLRALHLDELPELWHILRGEMSFVGPRPLPRSLMAGLDTAERERVPPGWTGPAQIWLLTRGQLDKRHQLALDNMYVQRRSVSENLRLIGATLYHMLRPARPDLRPDATRDRRRFLRQLQNNRTVEIRP